MPALDAFLVATGIGFWYGFSVPLLIHVIIVGAFVLEQSGHSSKGLVLGLRVFVSLVGLFGLLGFALFQGQLTPSGDITGISIFLGLGAYLITWRVYRRLHATS